MSETNQNCRLCNDCRSSFETEHRKDIAKKEINDLAEQYGKED